MIVSAKHPSDPCPEFDLSLIHERVAVIAGKRNRTERLAKSQQTIELSGQWGYEKWFRLIHLTVKQPLYVSTQVSNRNTEMLSG